MWFGFVFFLVCLLEALILFAMVILFCDYFVGVVFILDLLWVGLIALLVCVLRVLVGLLGSLLFAFRLD